MKKALTYLLFMLFPVFVFCQKPATSPTQKQLAQLKKDMENMQQQLQYQLRTLQESASALNQQLQERNFNVPGKRFHSQETPEGRGYFFHPGDQANGDNFFIPKREELERWKDAIKDFQIPQLDLKQWKEQYPDLFRMSPPNWQYDFKIPEMPPLPPPVPEFKKHHHGCDDWKHGLPFYDWFNKS